MILSNSEILAERRSGTITIDPFDDRMLQPASYDLKVGKDAATIPTNGDATLNLEKEGFIVISPYAPAIIYAMEHIRLPLDIAGRFGLKSGLSRRGIYASVGPQVDPGYNGKLSVTLFNLTSLPVALDYGDAFLSLELHRLGRAATSGYDGDYQNRETFTGKEIEQVLGYKGHALTDVVKGFDDLRDAVKGVASMAQKIDKFMEQHRQEILSMQEFNHGLMTEMKRLVAHITGERTSTVILRTLSHDEARSEIVDLFKSTKGPLFYSDIAERLQMDLEQVLEITAELEREGVIGELGSNGQTEK